MTHQEANLHPRHGVPVHEAAAFVAALDVGAVLAPVKEDDGRAVAAEGRNKFKIGPDHTRGGRGWRGVRARERVLPGVVLAGEEALLGGEHFT